MRQLRSIGFARQFLVTAFAVSFGVLSGCGGGGGGGLSGGSPLVIDTTSLAPAKTGDEVDLPIEIHGGAGGGYAVEVIEGALPTGVVIDQSTVSLKGRIKADGLFHFRIKITDLGDPHVFPTATQVYDWTITKGVLAFVTPVALPDQIYGDFGTIEIEAIGGQPPYTGEEITLPGDTGIPLGFSLLPGSLTLYGGVVEIGPTFPNFTFTIRATDSLGAQVQRTFTLKILVPDVVIITQNVPNGTCGQGYSTKINVTDGIKPFRFKIVDAINSSTKLLGDLASTGGVAKGDPTSAYAVETATSTTYVGKFPEGVYIRDTTGEITGIPRRAGPAGPAVFKDWTFQIQSAVLPDFPSQNRWRQFTFTMLNSVPPNVALDNTDLLPGSAFGTANNAFQGPEKLKNYSKQFHAKGGCPSDGFCDAPHESQLVANTEVVGGYDFSGTIFATPLSNGTLSFSAKGLFSGIATNGSLYQNVTIKAEDAQLPLPRAASHIATGVAKFEIGPDTVVITEGTQSSGATVLDATIESSSQTVEILEPFSSGAVVRALASADMTATSTHPLGGSLAGSLSGIDFLRTSVNPTWWAYDGFNTNARAARAMQHGDPERMFRTDSFGSSYSYNTQNSSANINTTTYNEGRERASNPAIEIPVTKPTAPIAVTHSPSTGVYTDGGRLYTYDKSGEFGFFIVRNDSKIYIPWCSDKSTYTGLGDAWLVSGQGRGSQMRMPQISVSPDGRMAAAKLKPSVVTFNETAASEKIVVFSLTGEKLFGTSTFVILSPGGSGNTTDGQYLYGSSLTLTNFGIYALRGNNIATTSYTGDRVIYGDHWVYRAQLFNTSTGAYLSPTTLALFGVTGSHIGGWTNSTGSPMSCCFQRWSSPGSAGSIQQNVAPPYTFWQSGSGNYSDGPFSSLNQQTSSGSSVTSVSPDFFAYHWANFFDTAGAPHPFRVSADGRAVAIVAGTNQSTAPTSNIGNLVSGFLNRSVYVDFNFVLREAASSVRRYKAPARTIGLFSGESVGMMYGTWDGPATQLEISDDGTRIAAVYNASTLAWYAHPIQNLGYYQSDSNFREELAYFGSTAGGSDPWSGKTQVLVTSNRFYQFNCWRIGCLAFTRDGGAITFFAGSSGYGSTTPNYTYQYPNGQLGSLYAYTISSDTLEGILPYSAGGQSGISGSSVTYTTSSPNNNTVSGYGTSLGAIIPGGSFLSNDGKFYWVVSQESITSSDPTSKRLVGVNISATTGTVAGRTALRAFAPSWPGRFGFRTDVAYYYGYYHSMWCFGSGDGSSTVGSHGAAMTSGRVFFASNLQGYYNSTNSYSNYNNPYNYPYYYGGYPYSVYYYGTYMGDPYASAQLFAMDTNLAGTPIQVSTTLSTSAEYRNITYIQPSADGTRVAYVTTQMNTGSYYQNNPAQERLYVTSGIASSASGAISTTGDVGLETANCRVSSSIALDTTGTRVYYGVNANATNENAMVLVEKTLNTTGTSVSSTRTFNGINNTPARFAVLWCGR